MPCRRVRRFTFGKRDLFVVALVLGTSLPLLGCQYGHAGPELAETVGFVTWKGEPLAGAMVAFIPDRERGTSGPMAIGVTDREGRYTLVTSGTRSGAILGEHRVSISLSADPYSDMPPTQTLPMRYADETTSGLTAHVVASKTNTLDFDLK
ncbi:hypothetical protein Pan216_05100 [Planctomycetes bacterium Pan216]|uniref:Nickel uptake substrate-specific transmembrane region n=1 Tax=Kolteria novifilia TaxID=2527975 RepID=A0A518AY71_9BACT|nr:hypothetical protein Pan216_05100 [Planctomycetes bacterium Pan216]